MRTRHIGSLSVIMLFSLGCAKTPDDGYLEPPGVADFDRQAGIERAHRELRSETYLSVTIGPDCGEDCELLQKGWAQARRLRIDSPHRCSEAYSAEIWGLAEFQEGCRAYALQVIGLVERYQRETQQREGG